MFVVAMRNTKRAIALILFVLLGGVVVNLFDNIRHIHRLPAPLRRLIAVSLSLDADADDYADDYDADGGELSSCSPQKTVFFLKTHKCASSTLQNILMRYGLNHNLSFVLPRSRYHNNAGFPNYFDRKFILPNEASNFHIFCHHCRYRHDAIRELMPNGTVFLSIVRNPIDVFESAVRYFSGTKLSLVDYIAEMKSRRREIEFYSQNPMLFDFGVSTVDNKTEMESAILERVKQFDLILLSDYFEESVVLMKNALCWTMEDVVYVVHNKRKNSTRRGLSRRETRLVQEWNYGDEMLYSIVNRTFWQRVQQLGEARMQAEIKRLQRVRSRWQSRCIANQTTNEHIRDPRMKNYHSNAIGYLLKPEVQNDSSCVSLVTPELTFTRDLYLRQMRLFP